MRTPDTTPKTTRYWFIISVLLLIGWPVAGALAQTDNLLLAGAENTKAEDELCRIAHQMEAGVYERIINFGYIPSKTYQRDERLTAHNEFTLLFLRFAGFEPDSGGTAYIGRVFMSERYLEKDYNRKYTSRAAYQTDKDGFFVACKLYFDERTLEYRLNIYPDHLLNICRKSANPFKGMHFNQKACTGAAQHWASLKCVLSIDDRHYDQFSDENDSLAVHSFLGAIPARANICKTYLASVAASIADSLPIVKITQLQKNMLREINLRKQIKCFRVEIDKSAAPHIAPSLTLRFTKYALSDDLLDNTTYSYTFIPYEKLSNTQLAERGQPGVFMSRNPVYRSLILSAMPDDNFIPGISIPLNSTLVFGRDYKLDSSAPSPVKSAPILPVETDYVVSSPDTARALLWVYGGRWALGGKISQAADTVMCRYQLPADHYLRDGVPTMTGPEGWQKGRITFGIDGGIARKGTVWEIDRVAIIPQNNYRYLWLNIKPVPKPKPTLFNRILSRP